MSNIAKGMGILGNYIAGPVYGAYTGLPPVEKCCDTCIKADMYGCPDNDECQDCERNFKHVDHWEPK